MERHNDEEVIVKYIGLTSPYHMCNFRCSYCYLGQHPGFNFDNVAINLPELNVIDRAFSKKRVGGTALFGICAAGETLLHHKMVPIICKLVEIGHYVHIVTNGTVSKAIREIIAYCPDMKKVFIKFSYHYLELLRTGLMDTFVKNVKDIKKAGGSYTIEMVACDEYLPYVQDIKDRSLKEFGALPQLTIPRKDTDKEIGLLSRYSVDEYKKKWSEFDSELFEHRMQTFQNKHDGLCMAGKWSLMIDLSTGDICQCLKRSKIGNAYTDLEEPLKTKAVGFDCQLAHCYNAHVYYTLGNIRGYGGFKFSELRNRNTQDGNEWLSQEIKRIFSQRLYENNKPCNYVDEKTLIYGLGKNFQSNRDWIYEHFNVIGEFDINQDKKDKHPGWFDLNENTICGFEKVLITLLDPTRVQEITNYLMTLGIEPKDMIYLKDIACCEQ